MAGGGLNGAQSCLAQESQEAGMWNEIWTNSWPFMITVDDLPSPEVAIGGVAFSSGLRLSPSPAYKILEREN